MKRRIRLTESELHNIIKKSVSRILREGENEKEDWKSPLDKTKENKFKVKGKMDVSGYRKKNLHGKIRKDTIGDNIDDETMKKLKKLHSENYIRKAVRESVNRVLKEGVFGSEPPYYWSISELRKSGANLGEWEAYQCVEDSASSDDSTQSEFETPDDAYSDGLEQLKYYNDGHYCMEVYYFTPNGAGDYVSGYYAEIHNGRLKQF